MLVTGAIDYRKFKKSMLTQSIMEGILFWKSASMHRQEGLKSEFTSTVHNRAKLHLKMKNEHIMQSYSTTTYLWVTSINV
jgi:hypothetical protein